MSFYSGTPKLCLGLSQECQTAVLKLLLRSLMVYPQNLACAPKIVTQRVHIPSAEYWSGHAVLMGTHNIGFNEELSKIIITEILLFCEAYDIYIYIMTSLLTVL